MVQSNLVRSIENLHSSFMSNTPPKHLMLWEKPLKKNLFRASSLPLCPMKLAFDTLRPASSRVTFSGDFYTSVGTAVHETLQKWFSLSGTLFGKYKCPQCSQLYPKGCTLEDNKATLGPVYCSCTKSKNLCSYVELAPYGIDHAPGFTGHVDGVALINGKYTILEFKTTSTAKVALRRKSGPDPKHITQATAYRSVMPKFLNIKESKWHDDILIIYYDRANPKNNVVLCVPYEYDNFQDEVDTFVKTLRLVKSKRYWKIKGKCEKQSDEQYCPYNAMCFSPQSDRLIDSIMPGYVKRKTKSIKIKR